MLPSAKPPFPPQTYSQVFLGNPLCFSVTGRILAATLLERGHAAWEDQALPIVFLGAANDHGYSNPKIRKRADCYPLSETAPHRRGKAERAYVLRIRWPELESRGRNASKLLKSPKLNLQLPCSRVFLASPAAAARGNTLRVGCKWGHCPAHPMAGGG